MMRALLLFGIQLLLLCNIGSAHHMRASQLTCGYAAGNTSILVQYTKKHTPQILTFQYSEVQDDPSRLLPWKSGPVVTCRGNMGALRCVSYLDNGDVDYKWTPSLNSTIEWKTENFGKSQYLVPHDGFYCTNVTINTDDEFPLIVFDSGGSDTWGMVFFVLGSIAFFVINAMFMFDEWRMSKNADWYRSHDLLCYLVGTSCYILSEVLYLIEPSFRAASSILTTQSLTIAFQGVLRGLLWVTYSVILLGMSFNIIKSTWQEYTIFALPIAAMVFALSMVDGLFSASYFDFPVPGYYPQGLQWCLGAKILAFSCLVGYLYYAREAKSNYILREVSMNLIYYVSAILIGYALIWIMAVSALFIRSSTGLDHVKGSWMIGFLSLVGWVLKTTLPGGILWVLACTQRESVREGERLNPV